MEYGGDCFQFVRQLAEIELTVMATAVSAAIASTHVNVVIPSAVVASSH